MSSTNYKTGIQARIVGVYLFLLLATTIYFQESNPGISQFILWFGGPITAGIVIIPNGRSISKMPSEVYFYGSLIIFALLGLPFVQDVSSFYRYFQVLVSNLVLLTVVFLSVRSLMDFKMIVKAIWLSCAVLITGSFILDFNNEVNVSDEYYRMTGLLSNANGLANIARVCIGMAFLLLAYTRDRVYKSILWVSIVLATYATILSASRSNFAILIFLCFAYFFWIQKRGLKLFVVTAVISFTSIFAMQYVESYFKKFYIYDRLTRTESLDQAVEEEARIQIYADAIQVYSDYPFLGVGLNQFRHVSKFGKISHSDILDIAVQLGTLAAIFYILIYVKIWFKLNGLKNRCNKLSLNEVRKIIIAIFLGELLFGIGNPNWFTQLQIVVLGVILSFIYRVIHFERKCQVVGG